MVDKTQRFSLTSNQRANLVSRLGGVGFRMCRNYIDVENPREGHPKHSGVLLSVGYLTEFNLFLLNPDETALKDYYDKLRQLYDEVTTG